MHTHDHARRACDATELSEASEACDLTELHDFGSNAERTDEVEASPEQPLWFEEATGLASRTTEEVFVGDGERTTEEAERSPRWASEEGMTADTVEASASEVAPAGRYPTAPDVRAYRPSGLLGEVHAAHQRRLADGIELELGLRESDLGVFKDHFARHRARYQAVSAMTNMPAKLIAALHWRESSGRFDRYLHQGDPIGRPSRNIPRGVLFYDWETAAVDALTRKGPVQRDIGITSDTTNTAAIATYAERYNGLGYFNKGRPSPYVYAGTGEYQSGKYVKDSVYSPTHVDGQLGVVAMVGALGGLDSPLVAQTTETAWARVVGGGELLRRGSQGGAVRALQEKLVAAGVSVVVDGDFGPGTEAAVLAFQRQAGLVADGIVGAGTASAL